MSPYEYTLRELAWMAEARDQAAWNRTFAVLVQICNIYREERAEPIDPLQFFPWAERKPSRPPPPSESDRAALRQMFPGKRKG